MISLRDGMVTQPDGELRFDGVENWQEAHLEAALALAPDLLRLQAASPVTLRGSVKSGPRVSPDQMYVDSLQRLHVVEIKQGEAGLDAIAQALAYGDMFRMLPLAAIEDEQRFMSKTCQPYVLLSDLRRWAGSKHKGKSQGKVTFHAPPKTSPPGWSARHIVVAKSFSDEAKAFATLLTARGTSLELLQAHMRSNDDVVEVAMTPAFRTPWIEQAWDALANVWSSPKVRKEMEFVGWAEPLLTKGMSLALKKDRRVRLIVEIDEDGAWLCTRRTDGKAFPGTKKLVSGWWYWHLENLNPEAVTDLAGRIAVGLAEIFPARR